MKPTKSFYLCLGIFAATLVSLLGIAKSLNKNVFAPVASFAAHQAWSFIHGRLDIVTLPPRIHDLSFYNGRTYAYWPPLTAILYIPWVWITGPGRFPERFFAVICGSLNAVVVSLIVQTILPPGQRFRTFIVIFSSLVFALGTSNLIFSATTDPWYVLQLTTSTFLLLTILFVLKFRQSLDLNYVTLSSITLGLAVLGRTHLILALPLLLSLSSSPKPSISLSASPSPKLSAMLLRMLAPLACALIFQGVFNYLRFNSPFNFGIQYQNSCCKTAFHPPNLLRFAYFKFNFYVELLRIPFLFSDHQILGQGFSIFLQCPFLLLMFGGRYEDSLKVFRRFIWAALIGPVFFILCFAGTGFFQFGARYLHDVMPLAALLVLQRCTLGIYTKRMQFFLNVSAVVLGIASIAIQLWGVTWMAKH